MIDYENFYRASVQFLIDYARKNGLQSYVLGISGGIDSTVVAAIASEACRILNISFIGRSLPTVSNHDIEINTADLIGKAFCTNYKKKSIEADYLQLLGSLEREGEVSKLQSGNIKARLRMIYLYHLASKYKGCVLDTDNKTENELGFWTIHGDVGDVNCGIIHLWKTEVYSLADYLRAYFLYEVGDFVKGNSIQASIELVPTDGNGVSNGDCEQFGLENYNQVDDVLKTMYFPDGKPDRDKNMEYMRLIDSYNEQGVDKVMVLHQNSEYKRKHMPISPSTDIIDV